MISFHSIKNCLGEKKSKGIENPSTEYIFVNDYI